MADLFAVIWTCASGAPRKVGQMVLTEREHRITLTDPALAPYSLIASSAGLGSVVYASREGRWFEPHIQALLPQAGTLHAKLAQAAAQLALGEAAWRSASPREQSWHILLAAGHGGVGHLDVFTDDAAAQAHYREASAAPPQPATSALALLADYLDAPQTPLHAAQALSAGDIASVGGMMPKLLGCIAVDDRAKWDGVLYAPTACTHAPPAGRQWAQVLVKFEPKAHAGVLAMEQLCYAVHRRAGLSCPRTWLGTVAWQGRSLAALCSERFDRQPTPQGGVPASLAFASFATVLHSGNPHRYLDRTDARMDDLPQLLRIVSCQPAQDAQALFLRYLLALLTGNGDAHLDNWGMLGAWPQAQLSPVYDPAPMRAFGYNSLSALGLGASNVDWALGYVPPDLALRLADFAKQLGLRSDTAAKLRLKALAATQDYASDARGVWNARNPEPLAVFLHRIEQVRLALG